MKTVMLLWIALVLGLTACTPLIVDPGIDDQIIPPNQGSLEFRFIMPVYKIPKENIHRISLNFAWSVDSLYRGEFFRKVNVSDFQEVYTLNFPGDDYYYDAVITCSCGGDTCLNGDFPGGRFGMKHDFDKFTVEVQKTLVLETHFQ
jgi:hypothetical protein